MQMLIPIVHNYGGILGPAHPCGEKYMSFMNAKAYQRNPDILKEFDFMEIFNACEPQEVNDRAKAIAKQYSMTGQKLSLNSTDFQVQEEATPIRQTASVWHIRKSPTM